MRAFCVHRGGRVTAKYLRSPIVSLIAKSVSLRDDGRKVVNSATFFRVYSEKNIGIRSIEQLNIRSIVFGSLANHYRDGKNNKISMKRN